MPINSDGSSADFLVLQYREIDFLIHRSQFTGSSSLNELYEVHSGCPDYFDKYTDYNSRNLVLCDFDQFLMDNYKCKNPSRLKLCLIVNIADYNNETIQRVMKITDLHEDVHIDSIGLIVSSQVEIKTLSLNEFYVNPPGLDGLLLRNGLLGCRFSNESRIQFFIDIETNIRNILTGKNNENSIG